MNKMVVLPQKNKSIFQGTFMTGDYENGFAKVIYPNGKVLEGKFVNAAFREGKIIFPDGTIIEGKFEYGVLKEGKIIYHKMEEQKIIQNYIDRNIEREYAKIMLSLSK